MKKTINIILTVIFCICLVLFMLTFAIGLPIYGRFFYYIQAKALDFDKQSGFSYAQIKQAYDEVLDFCTLPWVKQFSSGSLKVSAAAQAHFADCKLLFNLNLGVLLSSGAVLLTTLILNKLKIITILNVKGHRAYLISAAIAVALPVLIIIIIAAVGFDTAFEGFHTIFFPGKDNWVFDWYEDEIIRIMPEEFFMNCAIIIASGLIGFAAALIAADAVLYKKQPAKHKNPFEFYLFSAFIIAESAIYVAFNVISIGFNTDTNILKFFGIVLCFTVAALNCLKGKKDNFFIAGALFFTVVADVFLLLLDDSYSAYGIAAFIVVQAIHFARIYVRRNKKPIISGAVRIGVAAVILIVLGATGNLTALTALSAIYFPQLVINAIDSAFLIKYSKRYIMFFIGLVLFIGCDICVGLFNFERIGIMIPAETVENIIIPAIWIFYLPSQVLIAMSADRGLTALQTVK